MNREVASITSAHELVSLFYKKSSTTNRLESESQILGRSAAGQGRILTANKREWRSGIEGSELIKTRLSGIMSYCQLATLTSTMRVSKRTREL